MHGGITSLEERSLIRRIQGQLPEVEPSIAGTCTQRCASNPSNVYHLGSRCVGCKELELRPHKAKADVGELNQEQEMCLKICNPCWPSE